MQVLRVADARCLTEDLEAQAFYAKAPSQGRLEKVDGFILEACAGLRQAQDVLLSVLPQIYGSVRGPTQFNSQWGLISCNIISKCNVPVLNSDGCS